MKASEHWIARDKDGTTWLYDREPQKANGVQGYFKADGVIKKVSQDDNFDTLKPGTKRRVIMGLR